MGGLFSRPKVIQPPSVPAAVTDDLSEQEATVAAEEQEARRRVRSRAKARRRGRGADLMAPGVVAGDTSRDVLQTNLGAGRNPRG